MTKEEAWRKAKGYLYDALSGEEADEIIKTLEPKTGHWIEISRGFECDQCHGIDTDGLEPPYCKWCGAKMKGGI